MYTVEAYKNIKEEFHKLLTEGESLLEEDELFLEQINNSIDPKGVFDLVKEFKAVGNALFKQKKMEDALEKYGFAGIILARYDCRDEDFMRESYELIICLQLNSAACFGKIGKFDHVGRICTLILDFDSENVKALFRRAGAAIELGRNDLAYWDLMLAIQIDPNNLEVSKKHQQVKSSLLTSQSKKHQVEAIPTGLEIGNSSPPKRAKNFSSEKVESEQSVSRRENVPGEMLNEFEENNTLQSTVIVQESIKGKDVIDADMDKVLKETKTDIEKNANNNVPDYTNKMEIENEEKDDIMKDVSNDFHTVNYNQAKPMYRFSNRRRPSSFISISRDDYELLKKGISIKCMHTITGSLMMIRVLQKSKEHVKDKIKCDKEEVQELYRRDLQKQMTSLSHEEMNECENDYKDDTAEAAKQANKLERRSGSKLRRKGRSSLSVCDESMKIAKSQSRKYKRKKTKSHRMASKGVNQQQCQNEEMYAKSICQFCVSAVKRKNS